MKTTILVLLGLITTGASVAAESPPANRFAKFFGEWDTVDDRGDLRLKVSFEGEAPGTYRIYTYRWLDENSYELKSVQYDSKDKATGLFYGGVFVREPASR